MPSRLSIATFILAGCALAMAGCGSTSSEDGTAPQATETSGGSLLFVQGARSARVTDGGIVLTDATAGTLAFSDRPVRRAGTIPTARFAARFRRAFADDPPNAAISVAEDTNAYVVELSAPRFDQGRRTLSYAITRVPGSPRLPARIGPLSVFIDSGADLFGRLATRLLGGSSDLVLPQIPSRFGPPQP
ncbi:MAG: hypothetical protein QOI10_1548 [Solirubrobacterales bacterium]|jgi:hypothetical protein|nr:hypothetical protein [Solirubrobacterales bacterium]